MSVLCIDPVTGSSFTPAFGAKNLPGGRLESKGHSSGMEEYIIVYEGELGIEIDNETYTLSGGDAIKFCAECCHLYFNKANSSTKFYLIMYYS
jgi:XRE family transcriptional regulator, regulator of sulfur utilization